MSDMQPPPTPPSLSERLMHAFQSAGGVLFAGAGCSVQAGVPGWEKYLEHLAAGAQLHEPDIAGVMRRRIKDGAFLEAATFFKRYLLAPSSDKIALLVGPFRVGRYDATKLLALASLPFSAVVTTNYDSSLLEAWTTIRTQRDEPGPQVLELRQIRGAAYERAAFLLFLHGRASLPLQAESMVLDEEDYRQLYGDAGFTDGLLEVLSHRTCIFLGFSFRDPALRRILDTWTKLRGPAFPVKHFAVLPESEHELAAELTRKHNVEVIAYDSANGHSALWAAVRSARPPSAAGTSPGPAASVHLFEGVRSIIGLAYACASLGSELAPLREVVVDGVIVALLNEASLIRADLVGELGKRLGMLRDEVEPLAAGSLRRLERTGAIEETSSGLISTGKIQNSLHQTTVSLAGSVRDRLKIRHGVDLPESAIPALTRALEDLLVARACDLAAHFSQPRLGTLPGIEGAIGSVIRATSFPPGVSVAPIEAAMLDLLVRPNQGEARLLADLGRVAFSLQLALGHARSSLAQSLSLPERLYFDASVLMPAIVPGHPLRGLYKKTLQRLRDQGVGSGSGTEMVAPFEFLNEVVTHRANATRLVEELRLEDHRRLEREALLLGTENTNVFVGAYAGFVGREGRKLSFRAFLAKEAPYTTEGELEQFLRRIGFRVERLAKVGARESWPMSFWDWFNPLKEAYEVDGGARGLSKIPVLIEHEAWQLARLAEDHASGVRSVFVTADGKLRRAVAIIRDGILGDSLLAGLTLVNMVDLLLGVAVDHRALARLLWGIHAIDAEGKVRRYFTDLGLKRRGDVETLALPEVVEKTIEEIKEEQALKNVPFHSHEVEDRVHVADMLDRFEDRFYELLKEAVVRREQQEQREQRERLARVPPSRDRDTAARAGKGHRRHRRGTGRRP